MWWYSGSCSSVDEMCAGGGQRGCFQFPWSNGPCPLPPPIHCLTWNTFSYGVCPSQFLYLRLSRWGRHELLPGGPALSSCTREVCILGVQVWPTKKADNRVSFLTTVFGQLEMLLQQQGLPSGKGWHTLFPIPLSGCLWQQSDLA